MEYVTSRGYTLPESLADLIWFNMWSSKLWPYIDLVVGDMVYWYETTTKRVVWKTRVEWIDHLEYQDKEEVLRRLKQLPYNLERDRHYQKYYDKAPPKGFCLLYEVSPLQKLTFPRPEHVNFPRQGWLRLPAKGWEQLGKLSRPEEEEKPLAEDAYYRESVARQQKIIPLHNRLSNEFRKWLRRQHGIDAVQEQQRVDICFNFKKQKVRAELKVCYGVGTTKSIREALGQLLEYNHYPPRIASDVWLIVLDNEPSAKDRQFIELLRENRSLPLAIGWRSEAGFSFHPQWPQD